MIHSISLLYKPPNS